MARQGFGSAYRGSVAHRCLAGLPSVLVWSIVPAAMLAWAAESETRAGTLASSVWVGIRIEEVRSLYAEALGVRTPHGAMLSVVYPRSPAEQAGLRPGDVITKFGPSPITACQDLERAVGQATIDTKYRVEFHRGEQLFFVELTTTSRPPAPAGGYGHMVDVGLHGDSAGSPLARELGIESPAGMVVGYVTPDGAAAQAGLRRGDLIVMFGGHEIQVFEDYQAILLRSPIGSEQPVSFLHGEAGLDTRMHMTAGPRPDPPRWYRHPQGAFRFVLPPSWYVFPKESPGQPPETQYDWVISARGSYQLRLCKGSWDTPDAEAALRTFLHQYLAEHAEAQSGQFSIGTAPAAWVAFKPQDSPFLSYWISLVHQRRRYVIHAMAPVLSDPGELPEAVDWVLQSIEFLPVGTAGVEPSPTAQPSPPATASPGPAPVPAGWITKTIAEVTVSVPPDWAESEFSAEGEGVWYEGDPLRSEASFSLLRDVPLEEAIRRGTIKGRTSTNVGGMAAERMVIEVTDPDRPEKGIVVVLRYANSGRSLTLAGFAVATQWDQYEKVLDQIFACIRLSGTTPANGKQ